MLLKAGRTQCVGFENGDLRCFFDANSTRIMDFKVLEANKVVVADKIVPTKSVGGILEETYYIKRQHNSKRCV